MKWFKKFENILTILLIIIICTVSWVWATRNDIVFLDHTTDQSWQKLHYQLDRQLRISKKIVVHRPSTPLSSKHSALINLIDGLEDSKTKFETLDRSFQLASTLYQYLTFIQKTPTLQPALNTTQYLTILSDLFEDIEIEYHRFKTTVFLYNARVSTGGVHQKLAEKLNYSPISDIDLPFPYTTLGYIQ